MVRYAGSALEPVTAAPEAAALIEAQPPERRAEPEVVHPAPVMREAARRARSLVRRLLRAPQNGPSPLSFYAAMRQLECRFRALPRIGEAALPSDEPIRLAQDPSLAFQAAAVASVSDASEQRPARIGVGFFGAFGPHGPLPTHLTEYAYERQRHHADGTLVGFLDVFHHRLLSLLYRSWADAQPTVSHDRAGDDRFAQRFGALIGVATPHAPKPFTETDHACLFTAVHFSCQTRHPEGLRKVLQAAFDVEVRVEEFVGRWIELPDELCWRVPAVDSVNPHGLGALGQSTRVGTEVWDQQSLFGVTVGPLRRNQYEAFVPGGRLLPRLLELIERYAGPEQSFRVRLVLHEPERRPAVLGVVGATGVSAHLAGGDGASSPHYEDLVLDPNRLPT